jgi:hypothetical protein
MVKVDAEPGQQGNGLGIATSSFAQTRRSLHRREAGHAPGVVGHHVTAADWGDHEHPAGATTDVGLAGMLAQPVRLLLGSAFESVKAVAGRQQPG